MVRPMMEYPHPRETKVHAYKVHQDLRAQELHDKLQRATGTRLPDWRELLEDMMLATPLYLDGIVEVHIPPHQAHLLLSPEREGSVWDIRSRTRSYMELETRPRNDGSVILRVSGARSAIDEAITSAVDVTEKIKVVLLSNGVETVLHDAVTKNEATNGESTNDEATNEDGFRISVPYMRYNISSRPPIFLKTQANGVPKPDVWTKESFEEYVYTLTQGIMPNSLAGRLYPQGVTHAAEVTKQLHRTFDYPAARPAQTLEAFKMALKYIARRGPGSRPNTRALFLRAEKNGMEMDTTVFNILAENCVKQKDLRNFAACVQLMLRRGFEPNIHTWMLFLKLVQDEQVKRYIFQAMHSRNLVSDRRNLATVALNMASYDAERAVRDGWYLKTFLDSQRELYGHGWLSFSHAHHTANRILDVLLKHSKFPEAEEFIAYMTMHPHINLNVITLNICLHHAKIHKHMRFARAMVDRFEKVGITPDAISLDHLFSLYWQKSWPHSIDIVWQYSLLVLKTQYHMRVRIAGLFHTGFKNEWDKKELDVRSLSKAEMRQAGLFALLHTSAKKLLQGPVGADRDGILMKRLVGRAHTMRDEGWVPIGGLGALLDEAAEKDSRFYKGAEEGHWVLEPVELPKEKSLSKEEWSSGSNLIDNEPPVESEDGAEVVDDVGYRDVEEI